MGRGLVGVCCTNAGRGLSSCLTCHMHMFTMIAPLRCSPSYYHSPQTAVRPSVVHTTLKPLDPPPFNFSPLVCCGGGGSAESASPPARMRRCQCTNVSVRLCFRRSISRTTGTAVSGNVSRLPAVQWWRWWGMGRARGIWRSGRLSCDVTWRCQAQSSVCSVVQGQPSGQSGGWQAAQLITGGVAQDHASHCDAH